MTLTIGSTLAKRYRIEKKLGEGGFGAVYKVWDDNLHRYCAIKENLDLENNFASGEFSWKYMSRVQ